MAKFPSFVCCTSLWCNILSAWLFISTLNLTWHLIKNHNQKTNLTRVHNSHWIFFSYNGNYEHKIIKRSTGHHEKKRNFYWIFTLSQALYLSYISFPSWQPHEVGSIICIPIFRGENWSSGSQITCLILYSRHIEARCFRLIYQTTEFMNLHFVASCLEIRFFFLNHLWIQEF